MATQDQIESLRDKLLSMGEKRSISEILGRNMSKKIGDMPIKDLRSKVMAKIGMNQGGMTKKKKGMAKGGANMKKKAYAKGGTVATYNVGGMVKSSGPLNTGIKKAPDTYNKD